MESRGTRVALGVWVALVLAFLYVPIFVICLYAFNKSNVQSWPLAGLTTRWFSPAIHNPDMQQADVALVVGANYVVNPAARTEKTSPIYGMPIIDADRARTVFAIKRSKNPGFAGIDNELYFSDKTWMLFGDAKNVIGDLVKQLSGGSGRH